jgi:hypothetical protein
MGDKQDRVIVEMTIAAPVETVWDALRDPEQLLNWFGWDADTLADEVQFIFFDHAEVDEARKVVAFGEYEGSADRIELTAAPGGTILRVVRSSEVTGDWSGVYEDTWEGWITFFHQLRHYIERHPGAKRRTLFLSGELQAPGPLPTAALGLGKLMTTPVGSAAASDLPLGEQVTGTVWHQTRHQVGITAAEWGDGLMVITDRPAPSGGAHGGGIAVLTTFGLSDEAFAALEQRWKAWWEPRFPNAG